MFQLTELLRTLHGWLGLLAAVLLFHPFAALRPRAALPTPNPTPGLRRGLRWSTALAGGLTVAAFASGWWLYPGYREDTKPALLVKAPTIAAGFEVKEHLAFYVLCLALAGTGLVWRGGPWARPYARTALLLAAVLGLVVSGLGAWVGGFNPR